MTDILSQTFDRRTGQTRSATSAPKRSRTPILVAGVLALATAAAGVWYWRKTSRPPVAYVTAPVDRGPVARTITATGSVNPVLTVVVGSYVSGVVRDISCDFNTAVRKGQVCATIDPRPYQLAAEQSRAALDTAVAQLAKDKAGLDFASLTFDRYSGLLQQDSIARETVDNARSQLAETKAQVALDEAAIRERRAALRAAEVSLGYTKIVSPVDGTVVSRNVTIGQTVAASFQTPTLFLIAQDLAKMQVDTSVSESDIAAGGHGLSVGSPATFTVESFPDTVFKGVVSQVRQAPQTVQNVVTYDVVVAVDNSALLLRPGMTATVHITTDHRDDVLRVPNQALRFAPGGLSQRSGQPARTGANRVWLLRDGTPAEVEIRPGLADDSHVEIAAGPIRAGERVIIAQRSSSARKRGGAATPLPRL